MRVARVCRRAGAQGRQRARRLEKQEASRARAPSSSLFPRACRIRRTAELREFQALPLVDASPEVDGASMARAEGARKAPSALGRDAQRARCKRLLCVCCPLRASRYGGARVTRSFV